MEDKNYRSIPEERERQIIFEDNSYWPGQGETEYWPEEQCGPAYGGRTRQERRRARRGSRALSVLLVTVMMVTCAGVVYWGFFLEPKQTASAGEPAVMDQSPNKSFDAGTAAAPEEVLPLSGESGQPAEEEDWNLTLVNKWNPIPEDYSVDLVELEGGEKVDRRIYEPLMELLEAAREGNWGNLPIVVSGYRTQQKQQSLYDNKIAEYVSQGYTVEDARREAERWVAVPGYSEHQLGFAVDINGDTWDVYLWLQENAYKYGFIFRYPGHKSDITEVSEEVWHYRYVGKEAAAEMYERGLCLEEYLNELNG